MELIPFRTLYGHSKNREILRQTPEQIFTSGAEQAPESRSDRDRKQELFKCSPWICDATRAIHLRKESKCAGVQDQSKVIFFFSSPTIFCMSGPRAWVVQCNECGCIVTARAEDPQARMQDPEPRPTCRLLVTCSCCWTSWLYPPEAMFNGSPAPSPECFKRARQSARTENAKLIAAAVIAAIRLNREEIKNSPVVQAKISDSLKLAEMIVAMMKG